MTVREVAGPLARWAEEGQPSAVATLVRVRRSAPRSPGARFAVSGGGEVAGSVSSGCVEGDLFERLGRVLRGGPAGLAHYGITDEMAADVGLACGGEIDVLLVPHEPDDPAWSALREAVEAAVPVVLLTGLSEPIRGERLLLRLDGSPVGTLGDAALDEAAAEASRRLFDVAGAEVLEVERPGAPSDAPAGVPSDAPGGAPADAPGGAPLDAPSGVVDVPSSAPGGASLEVFAEAFLPPPRLAIVGATPVAAALSDLASRVGFTVTVIDPRETIADPRRFPAAERVIHEWPEEGLREAGLDRYLDVVVLAHDRKFDVPALEAALLAGCRYVGQIGGGRTQRLRREALEERGVPAEALDRIRGPVGLDIGAETPEEIALSILAELVAVHRGKEP